jgi:hypothetical protein
MTPLQAGTISKVDFDEAFTGNGKIFVKVEKQGTSENLVIYEKSGFAAFVADLFRNRADTFTLREWAHRKLGDLPQTFDKERLTQNIKQLQQGAEQEAPALINKLIADRKLDADPKIISNFIKNTPLNGMAFQSEVEKTLPQISDQLGLTSTRSTRNGEIKTTYFDKELWKQSKAQIANQIPDNSQLTLDDLFNSGSVVVDASRRAFNLSTIMEGGAYANPIWMPSLASLKPFAEFLLKHDSHQNPDDIQHQRYLTTLKLAIQKLEAIEFEQNRPKTKT